MIRYWQHGFGSKYNPDRKEALKILDVVSDIEEAERRILQIEGERPLTVVTDAQIHSRSVGYLEMRQIIAQNNKPYLVLFGTGWGLIREEIEKADYILHPIGSNSDYNHLSVRSAAAIILDRLVGENQGI